MDINDDFIKNNINIFSEFFSNINAVRNFDLSKLDSSAFTKSASKIFNNNEINKFNKIFSLYRKNNVDVSSLDETEKFIYDNLKRKGNEIVTNNAYIQYLSTESNLLTAKAMKEQQQHLALTLINVCSSFEFFIHDLMEFEILKVYKNDAIISNEYIKINLEEIKDIESIEDIKSNIANKYITKIQRSGLRFWVEDCLNICCKKKKKQINKDKKLTKDIDYISQCYELRNLFTHNGGKISKKSHLIINESGILKNKIKIENNKIVLSSGIINEISYNILRFATNIFILNINKNRYFNSTDYRAYITKFLVENIKDEPSICKIFFQNMIDLDINVINGDQNLEINKSLKQSLFFTDLLNLWLSYKITNSLTEFNSNYHNSYLKIKEYCNGNDMMNLLVSFIDNEDEDKIVDESIKFINMVKGRRQKINCLSSPIFDSIRNNDKFIEYAKQLRYN